MSLVIDAVLAAGGVALGRWLARSMRGEPGAPEEAQPEEEPPPPARIGQLPCDLGDVVVRVVERDEAWLAGALAFEEEQPVAALFVAPEAGGDRAVYVRRGEDRIVWLAVLPAGVLPLQGEPPHAIEHDGVRFERVRRLPVKVRPLGSNPPAVGDTAVIAEYRGAGAERVIAVFGAERALAWNGVELTPREYDVLPGTVE